MNSKDLLVEIIKVIESYDTKLTVRQIYYQLVSKHFIQNVRSQYQRVSKILVNARHNGDVDWDAIEDRTRQSEGGDNEEETPEEHFESAVKYLKNCWKYFKLPKWKNQTKYIEVWFEKQALQGIFSEETEKFNVVQLACKGYSSHTMGYMLQQRVESIMRQRPEIEEIHVVYFGDYDPSGLDIYRFIKDMCDRFGLKINFERIGITKEQIRKYNIPPMFAKSSDSRYNKFVAQHGTDVVELDALDPNVLKELIRRSILKHFNKDILEDVKQEEQEGRDKIQDMIKEKLSDNDDN